MNEQSKLRTVIGPILLVILGNIIYALSVKLFLLPAGLVTGGTTGIALAVHHMFNIPVSGFVLGFNVCMLIIGYLILGRKFALSTILSTFTYPIALEILDRLLGNVVLTQDTFLCALFAGLGIGLSLGIVIRSGASTGGMDIPPLVLNRFFKIPVSVSLYVFDIGILLLQAIFSPVEKLLYGLVLVMIYTIVLDRMMVLGTVKTEVKIVSKEHQAIRKAILSELDRGVTMLSAQSGYMEEDTQMIFSVISNRELPKIEKLIHEIDPTSFMVVSRISEVRGRGFSLSKVYK